MVKIKHISESGKESLVDYSDKDFKNTTIALYHNARNLLKCNALSSITLKFSGGDRCEIKHLKEHWYQLCGLDFEIYYPSFNHWLYGKGIVRFLGISHALLD